MGYLYKYDIRLLLLEDSDQGQPTAIAKHEAIITRHHPPLNKSQKQNLKDQNHLWLDCTNKSGKSQRLLNSLDV